MTLRRAAVWSLASQYATFVIQFAASVLISRLFLAPADVGLFSVALAAAMLVAIFQDMGISRFISGQPEMRHDALRDYAGVAVAVGWSVAAIVALAAPAVALVYHQAALAPLLWTIAASYLVAPFAIVPAAMLVREMDFRSLFAVNAGSSLVGNGIAIALAASGHGAASLAWGVLFVAVARSAIAMVLHPVRPRRPVSLASVRPMLGFGSMSFVLCLSNAVGQRSQDLIVGRILGLVATGLFSRATALAGQLTALVTGGIGSVFYAAFARKREAGEPLAEPYLHLVACYTAITWAAMAGLTLGAGPLVELLYGPRWAGAAPLLAWTALGELFFVAVPLQMDVPLLLGEIRKLVWINAFDTLSAVVILTAGCFLGLQAAGISRVVYGFVWWLIYAPYLARLMNFRVADLLAVYLRSAICALAAGAPLAAAIHAGIHLDLVRLVLLAGAGVACWLAALALVRHPAWAESRLFIATLARPLRARFA